MAFLALGDVIAAALFQTGRFARADAVYVWAILAGSAVGLLRVDARPAVLVDLLRAARHADAAALRDRPRRARDGARVLCRDSAAALARHSSQRGAWPGWPRRRVAGWIEMLLLRRTLNARIGSDGSSASVHRKALGGGGGRAQARRGR